MQHGRILGHEGLGTIESVGSGVSSFKLGDRVIISCITACGACHYCWRGMPSHCTSGGWILGNTIDGTQAEYVRIPHADTSLHHIPSATDTAVDEDALVMISDILPTALECGTMNGRITPGASVAVVGAGPVGLAAVLTAQLYSPVLVIVIDRDPARLAVAQRLGATHIIHAGADGDVVRRVLEITDGRGVDTAIEAVGIAQTFELCQDLIGVGGTIANVGVHGGKADLHLEKLWDRNVGEYISPRGDLSFASPNHVLAAITTRLVDAVTSPMLVELLAAGKLDAKALATHSFKFSDVEKAYAAFGDAGTSQALKVIINFD